MSIKKLKLFQGSAECRIKDPFLREVKSKAHIRKTANTLFSFLLLCPGKLDSDTELKKSIPTYVEMDFLLAENVGFEPTVPCGTTVFKTAAIDHSANSPGQK